MEDVVARGDENTFADLPKADHAYVVVPVSLDFVLRDFGQCRHHFTEPSDLAEVLKELDQLYNKLDDHEDEEEAKLESHHYPKSQHV